MNTVLDPIKTKSLKDVFVDRFENLILSGELAIGEKLPSERELALRLDVSRPVVHEGLVELAARGLVTITPRRGAVVNDYRQEGSLAMLTSLVNYQDGRLDWDLMRSLVDLRRLFEVETGRLAALNHTSEQMAELRDLVEREQAAVGHGGDVLAELDFRFHHLLALASGNVIYPLLLNSFKQVYTHLTRQVLSLKDEARRVHQFHFDLIEAVAGRDEAKTVEIMTRMLEDGWQRLQAVSEQSMGRST